ncbi:MAG: copper resistance protein CopC/CopD [Candidatus Bipolaricaulota bacterium]|nr:copper resistance protein CopC/CopD [Candidatus Bipolaricaulota bacterium]
MTGLLVLLGVLSSYSELFAHAYLLSADPPAGASLQTIPEKITLLFSEEIEPHFSSFDLYDAEGQLLQKLSFTTEEGGLRAVLALPQLAPGAYTVAWRVLSAIDGHITTGVLPFGVGVAPASKLSAETKLDLVRMLVRWGHSLALVLLCGMFVFAQFIWNESFAELWGLLGLALLASAGELLLYASSLGELSVLWGTRVGVTLSAQIAMLATMGIVLRHEGAWGWVRLALSLGALGMGAFSSHSAALKDPMAMVLDMAHRVAVGSWAGGLLALGFLLRGRGRSTPWGLVLPRFSLFALLSVFVIVGSGVYLAFQHISSLSALVHTDYGQFLVFKIALLTVILVMAALNFRQVRRDFRGEYGQTDLAPLRRRVWGELFTVVLAIGAASALALSPPPNVVPMPTVLVREGDGLRITLTISSLRVGPAHFGVQLRDAQGQPVSAGVQQVMLEFRYIESDALGAVHAIAEPTSAGDFAVHGLYLSVAGRWQIAVRVRLSARTEDMRAVFEVQALR